ncbi:Peptidase_S10 domain-containing protein [Cephalotus follicularis]|uniref:Peptidase_S10 domain-containing protein n=1 Tax=Cephalotus follicularis TaxID=3775 RepID=A0A1Q3CEV6_CEPFO|nr:Peptidase_S10 domain-containing protein [Cephalotus follicularis]
MAKRVEIFVSMVFVFLVVVVVSVDASHRASEEEEEADMIVAFPEQPKVSFQQFSGYVTVSKVAGIALFYWHTEATRNPFSKPPVLSLNGGYQLSLSLSLSLYIYIYIYQYIYVH